MSSLLRNSTLETVFRPFPNSSFYPCIGPSTADKSLPMKLGGKVLWHDSQTRGKCILRLVAPASGDVPSPAISCKRFNTTFPAARAMRNEMRAPPLGKEGSICHFPFSLVLLCLGVERYPDAGKNSTKNVIVTPPFVCPKC